MTRFHEGQSVRFRPLAARVPGLEIGEDTGTITEVIVERGNAQNQNASESEDDPRYEIQNNRGKKSVIMENDILGEEDDWRMPTASERYKHI